MTSAGILLYRRTKKGLQFFLVHPGGPFFQNRDEGAWSIPKGELDAGESALAAARREFREETGFPIDGTFIPLPPVTQKGHKTVRAWAVEGGLEYRCDQERHIPPRMAPRSGRVHQFPEVDRAAWFGMEEAKQKINPAQIALLDEVSRIAAR